MKQTVTIEIEDNTVLQLLHNLEAMSLVRFIPDNPSRDELLIARINEVYKNEDSSIDPSLMMVQAEAIGSEDWKW